MAFCAKEGEPFTNVDLSDVIAREVAPRIVVLAYHGRGDREGKPAYERKPIMRRRSANPLTRIRPGVLCTEAVKGHYPTLPHAGTLFLDELGEFSSRVLETLASRT